MKIRQIAGVTWIFFLLSLSSALVFADELLPFHGEKCRQGSSKELSKFISTLKIIPYASGRTESSTIYFFINRGHSYMYVFGFTGKDDQKSLCFVGGGREVDLVATDYLEKVKARWKGRIQRYHVELATRLFGKGIPLNAKNIAVEDAVVVMTAYFVQPDWRNAYDEEMTYEIGGKDMTFTRGEMVEIANRKIAEMDLGKEEMNNRGRLDFLKILENVDHGFNPIFLIIDKKDDDWAVVHIDRKKKVSKVILEGTNLNFSQ